MPDPESVAMHRSRATIARGYSRNGAARRDAALLRAERARTSGEEDDATYFEKVAAYHETHRLHEERHAALEEALASGETILQFEVRQGDRSSDDGTSEAPLPPRR